jgi:sortase (surface protein transpeptidase)
VVGKDCCNITAVTIIIIIIIIEFSEYLLRCRIISTSVNYKAAQKYKYDIKSLEIDKDKPANRQNKKDNFSNKRKLTI